MSTISKPYTFSPSTSASSSQVNADFDTIYNDYNGNISASNLATGAVSTAKIADGAVTTDKVNDAAVTNAKLAANTAWLSWTPTWTNLSVGNGTVTARYQQVGKIVSFRLELVFGSTTSISGSVSFSAPVTAASFATSVLTLGVARFEDVATNGYFGPLQVPSTTTIQPLVARADATYTTLSAWQSGVPFSFGTSDVFTATGTYEAA